MTVFNYYFWSIPKNHYLVWDINGGFWNSFRELSSFNSSHFPSLGGDLRTGYIGSKCDFFLLSFAWANMKICAPRLLFLLVFALFVFLCTFFNGAGTGQSDKYLWEDLICYHFHGWHISLLAQTAALASGLFLRGQETAYNREPHFGFLDTSLGSFVMWNFFRVFSRNMRERKKISVSYLVHIWILTPTWLANLLKFQNLFLLPM